MPFVIHSSPNHFFVPIKKLLPFYKKPLYDEEKNNEKGMNALSKNDQPLFKQIIASINEGIESGAYARGSAIPSEPELCRVFDTTRMTVRRAIDALVNEGKLYRVQGKGTFVSHIELQKTYQKHGFTSNMISLGIHPSSKVLSMGVCDPDDAIKASLEVEPGEPLFCLKRIRMADLEPIAIERVWISLKRFPKLPDYDYSETSLYEVLRVEYGWKRAIRGRSSTQSWWKRGRANPLWRKKRRCHAHAQRRLRQEPSTHRRSGFDLPRNEVHV